MQHRQNFLLAQLLVLGQVLACAKQLVEEEHKDSVTALDIDGSGIANINPIRYRGYYYDTDINLYYLKTRWYDPEVGRFVNMDDVSILEITQDYINGLNLYAYCFNDPVNHFDDDGMFVRRLFRGISSGFRSAVTSTWNAVTSFVTDPFGTVSNAFSSILGSLHSFATDPFGTMWGGIQSTWDNFLNPTAIFRNPEQFGYNMGQGLGVVTVGVATMGAGMAVGGGVKLVGNTKILNVGRITGVNAKKGYFGVRWQNKRTGGIRSLEFHPAHNSHGIHLQGNKWAVLQKGRNAGRIFKVHAMWRFELFRPRTWFRGGRA